MLIGIVLNTVSAGPIIVGMRVYLKHLPFFLLAAVYELSEEQFNKQLWFLLPLLILQCPLAVYQRLFQYRWVLTGDVITGTLVYSGTLSITMLCSIAVVFALYLKKKIGLKFFLITVCFLFLPCTLNETKSTVLLLPVALVFPAFFYQGGGISIKFKSFFTMALIGVLFMSAFIPIYDHLMKPLAGYGILDYLQFECEGRGYLYQGATGEQDEQVGRIDSIVLAYTELSKDYGALLFGLGMGNVMDTDFASFRGKDINKIQYKSPSLALTYVFWELGLLGVIVYATFFFFLFRDALLLRKSDNMFGSFALGWTAVIAIMGICSIYTNGLRVNTLNIMFWYFSGVVAAKASAVRALPKEFTLQRVSGAYVARSEELRK
jgi:hypothetical protein